MLEGAREVIEDVKGVLLSGHVPQVEGIVHCV